MLEIQYHFKASVLLRIVNYKVSFDISLHNETRIKCSITNRLNMVSAEASFRKSRFLTCSNHQEGKSSEVLSRYKTTTRKICEHLLPYTLTAKSVHFLLLLENAVQIQKQGNYLSSMSEISHCCFCLFYALPHSSGLSLKKSSL